MDRKGQLRNVAFGGAWSEQIAANEALRDALRNLEHASRRAADEDIRLDRALAADVALLFSAHPKGAILKDAWSRALGRSDPAERCRELARLAALARAGLGNRAS